MDSNQNKLRAVPARMSRFQLELDTRMLELWQVIDDSDELTLELVACLLRAAYGRGYVDAVSEPDPGALLREHGYKVPQHPA